MRPSHWRPSLGVEAPSDEATLGQQFLALFVNGPAGVQRHLLLNERVTIGRARGPGVVVDDPGVSRSHAVVGLRRGAS